MNTRLAMCKFILILSFFPHPQASHCDSGNHQRSEGRLPPGDGKAGVALWREPAECASPFLHQREGHHHPVSSLTVTLRLCELWHLNMDIWGTVSAQMDRLSDPSAGQISASLVIIFWPLKQSFLLWMCLSFQRAGGDTIFSFSACTFLFYSSLSITTLGD